MFANDLNTSGTSRSTLKQLPWQLKEVGTVNNRRTGQRVRLNAQFSVTELHDMTLTEALAKHPVRRRFVGPRAQLL
jgi:hypothetical protein